MNKRIFIQKKSQFDIHSQKVTKELQNLVSGISCKVFVIYDLFEITENQLEETLFQVFADPVTDIVHQNFEEILANFETRTSNFATEPLPGQYDQRADSADQCLQLVGVREAKVKSGYLYVFEGISESDLDKVKKYLINPIEAREKNLNELILSESTEIKPVKTIDGFLNFDSNQLENLHKEFGFSMGMDDLEFIQNHFQSIQRNPTETELKVLDTYWSDHCRHTTFETEITHIKFENQFKETLQNTFNYYLKLREELNITKPIRMMDLATIMGKYLSKTGKVNNIDISEEINACSIVVPIDVDGVEEEWLLQFKNETHNHPTEVEPFGGASTCVGGAIRDPLSGRAYVFQAMRVTGSANPLEKIEDTLPGKLPQRKITKEAANGYSSYGNQIGLATTYVKEIYDEGYKAKRMEVGFVAGAVKKDWVRREEPTGGDKVIVLGGRTGRDGVGGATGSSKTHDGQKLEELSSEVQKGNAIVERKIQRLFRNKEVLALIKKCNDFGAGGVSVAIGEIARGVNINLDTLPLKYTGLNGTELALSESQERMAVVVESKDAEKFIEFAAIENLEATIVANVTDDETMIMWWKGNKIVELDRKFLDTNGVRKQAQATIQNGEKLNPFESKEFSKENFIQLLKELNHTSQKGMVEMFDNNVGRSTVLNAFGGKTQSTPEDISVQKFPTDGFTNAVSMASFGFNPQLSYWSPYHGAYFAVMDSVAKIVAGGGDFKEIRLTLQEYFEKLRDEAERWGKPFAALLGSIEAQKQLSIPAIGGKDSMSGSYQEIDVPPTLISFAVAPNKSDRINSSTFQKTNSKISVFIPELKDDYLFDELNLKQIFETIHSNNSIINSAMTVKSGGIAETLALMAFGNEIGFEVNSNLDLMKYYPAAIVVEHSEELNIPTEIQSNYYLLGNTNSSKEFNFNGIQISMEETKSAWKSTFAELFPYEAQSSKLEAGKELINNSKSEKRISNLEFRNSKPKVFIPSFPGTNSEYDSAKAFRKEGAETEIIVFKNLSEKDIEETVVAYSKAIDNSQILFLPGGFSAADEPDGSGKFIATVLRNERIKESVHKLLERDGLVLGICNGFQGLIKSGLLPYGEIRELDEDTPTLTFNQIGRHITQLAKVRVNDSHSPWLKGMAGQEYWIPFSHGEGRFMADEKNLEILFEQNQIATQFIDLEGKIASEMPHNPNGSVLGIEGIVSPCGKIFGRMGHPERFEEGLFQNIPGIEVMNIFKNGVEYFL
ncbi:phosphoribosylformylglycinamidine synthase [Moheibacter sediminis]|uniref:Phosphoribosylformylglycinamidine synthase n=1 Tax=Moheibacter sediminis TaxID=1434700 RepID=A0A1W2CG48_9FLAO|nr:phosphoribosylformylglycinamidine synthase [Moheibacter sediminis]SMC84149.1 phosphoribosylformylglycinamidine synthase [Moheibacter sediminis]